MTSATGLMLMSAVFVGYICGILQCMLMDWLAHRREMAILAETRSIWNEQAAEIRKGRQLEQGLFRDYQPTARPQT